MFSLISYYINVPLHTLSAVTLHLWSQGRETYNKVKK